MQTVGELDDDHADILCHRHEDLAEVLRLLLFLRGELDLLQLGHAEDATAHGCVKYSSPDARF